MNIYEQISEALHKEWKEGATQQEIADRAGLTNAHINNLLSGKRKIESMKLETLLKLFPKVKIDLTGAQFAGMSEYQIKLAMWLADACIESAKLVISRRQIENISKAINALCDEIEASHLSLAKWMEQERTGEQLNKKQETGKEDGGKEERGSDLREMQVLQGADAGMRE